MFSCAFVCLYLSACLHDSGHLAASMLRDRISCMQLKAGIQAGIGIPRALRLCELCEGGEVEDLPHSLLRCPRYVAIRAQFGGLFDGVVDTADFFNGQDQVAVAHAIVFMLQFRVVALLL